jgi:hypothetical protein
MNIKIAVFCDQTLYSGRSNLLLSSSTLRIEAASSPETLDGIYLPDYTVPHP